MNYLATCSQNSRCFALDEHSKLVFSPIRTVTYSTKAKVGMGGRNVVSNDVSKHASPFDQYNHDTSQGTRNGRRKTGAIPDSLAASGRSMRQRHLPRRDGDGDLTPRQYAVLVAVSQNEGVSQTHACREDRRRSLDAGRYRPAHAEEGAAATPPHQRGRARLFGEAHRGRLENPQGRRSAGQESRRQDPRRASRPAARALPAGSQSDRQSARQASGGRRRRQGANSSQLWRL